MKQDCDDDDGEDDGDELKPALSEATGCEVSRRSQSSGWALRVAAMVANCCGWEGDHDSLLTTDERCSAVLMDCSGCSERLMFQMHS